LTRSDVAKTALFVAAVRARETERVDPLFNDRLSSLLAGPEGMAWLAASEADPASNYRRDSFPYLEVRTRWFDDWARDAVATSGARQLVLLGAGMDTRAFRLRWPEGFKVWEIDTPELFALKEARLHSAGVRAGCNRNAVEADLTSRSWVRMLQGRGFEKDQPTVWLAEGLFLYLTAVDVKQILRGAASISTKGSFFGAEIISKELLQRRAQQWALRRRKDGGIPWVFAADDPEELFRSSGWKVDRKVGALEAAKALRRLPGTRSGSSGVTRSGSEPGAYFVSAKKATESKSARPAN
jgi:methyltransferase (TIGR00027 family)